VTERLADRSLAPLGPALSRQSIVGTLVHRLIRAIDRLDRTREPSEQVAIAGRLLKPDEQATVESPSEIVIAAVEAYRRLRLDPELTRLLRDGQRAHEVPFSLSDDGVVVRGAIDCLIRNGDGSITVLEFKSGSPHADHRIQLQLYVRAARSMFPDVPVDGRLVYL
jgi:ATP-dependent exoDNAse (exonuclease V) beta subunit